MYICDSNRSQSQFNNNNQKKLMREIVTTSVEKILLLLSIKSKLWIYFQFYLFSMQSFKEKHIGMRQIIGLFLKLR